MVEKWLLIQIQIQNAACYSKCSLLFMYSLLNRLREETLLLFINTFVLLRLLIQLWSAAAVMRNREIWHSPRQTLGNNTWTWLWLLRSCMWDYTVIISLNNREWNVSTLYFLVKDVYMWTDQNYLCICFYFEKKNEKEWMNNMNNKINFNFLFLFFLYCYLFLSG